LVYIAGCGIKVKAHSKITISLGRGSNVDCLDVSLRAAH
jgi:hypothetical protein